MCLEIASDLAIFCYQFSIYMNTTFVDKIIMTQNINHTDADPLRVVLIGLPYAGKKLVASILKQHYHFQIIQNPSDFQPDRKKVASLLFDEYRGRSVYVMEKANYQTLKNLKKRNFVNVVLVEASILSRYQHYLKMSRKQDNPALLDSFIVKDDEQFNEDYQKCLQFVRVQIFNRKDIDFLKKQISIKQESIVKPFRPSWQQYFMKIADIARRRSNCMKSSVGAVIVNKQNRVVSTGYNGTARGLQSCFKGGCERCNSNSSKSLDQCLCLHAEESAIIEVGIGRTQDCHLYTTLYPCFSCAKVIKQAGIAKIYYLEEYDKEDSGKKFIESNFDVSTQVKQIKIDNIYY